MERCRILTRIYTERNSGDYAECYDSELLGALNTIIMLHVLYTHPSCRVQRRVLGLAYSGLIQGGCSCRDRSG